jgi:predicted amidophosphoribosyltransferase
MRKQSHIFPYKKCKACGDEFPTAKRTCPNCAVPLTLREGQFSRSKGHRKSAGKH